MMGKGSRRNYCFGTDEKGICLCYDRELLSTVFDIHTKVFSRIANIGFSVGGCGGNKKRLIELTAKRDQGESKMWRELALGILALRNSYRRNGFLASRDILVAKDLNDRTVIALHGHQLRDFQRGMRPEQAAAASIQCGEPDFVVMGHFHRLGIFRVPHYGGVVCVNGSRLFGPYLNLPEDYPEILSEMGTVSWHWDDASRLRFDVDRTKIDVGLFERSYRANRQHPASISTRIKAVRNDLKDITVILPGNHDPFEETHFHESFVGRIPNSGPVPLDSFGYGDYVDFTKSEEARMRKEFSRMLAEEGFQALTDVRKRLGHGLFDSGRR